MPTVLIVSNRVSDRTIRQAIPALYTNKYGQYGEDIIDGIKEIGRVKYITVDESEVDSQFSKNMLPSKFIHLKYPRRPEDNPVLYDLPSIPLRVIHTPEGWTAYDDTKGRKPYDDLNTDTDFIIQPYIEEDKMSDALNVVSTRGIPKLLPVLNMNVKDF
jgi:hypothetical protein